VRFMSAYARLARLPAPQKRPLDVATWTRAASPRSRRVCPCDVVPGPRTTVHGGRRSARSATSSIRSQRGRRIARDVGQRADPLATSKWVARADGRRTKVPGLASSANLVRAVLSQPSPRVGNRPRTLPPDAEATGGSLASRTAGSARMRGDASPRDSTEIDAGWTIPVVITVVGTKSR
jgi:hypothetical protein